MHDPRWEKSNYFDDALSFDSLRIMQNQAGPANVSLHGDLFVGDARKRLLEHVSLLAMACGVGKTLTVASLLFQINLEVLARVQFGPRIGRALWMVPERNLRVSLKAELEEEITKFGLHSRKPRVVIYDDTGDFERGPVDADIVICCPQGLWQRKDSIRTDAEVMAVLSHFDAIIPDECDFAKDQLMRLMSLAPHAIKIGITATPLDQDGDILRMFVLAAVASHYNAERLDHCLKPMLPWIEAKGHEFIVDVRHDGFARLEAGIAIDGKGTHGDRSSLPGMMATAKKAVESAKMLEDDMREAWPQHWFSPHILIRVSSIPTAKELRRQLNQYLAENGYAPDWRACAIFDGENEDPPLFHKSGKVHPFLRAKANGGRCDKGSQRILIVVDMAIRGLNNWPILYLVDLATSGSVSDQTQFKGRADRLPPMFAALRMDANYIRFLHPRYYFMNFSGSNFSVGAMEQAWQYAIEFDARFEAAGLTTWSDLLDGDASALITKEPQGTGSPFTWMDSLALEQGLAEITASGREPSAGDISQLVSALPSPTDESRDRRATEHATKILHDPNYRRDQLYPRFDIIRPVSREEPKRWEDYSIAELATFVRADSHYSDPEKLILLIDTMPEIRELIAKRKREKEERFYRPLPTIGKLRDEKNANGKMDRKGIITDILRDVWNELVKLRLVKYPQGYGAVAGAVDQAVCDITGVTDTSNGSPIDNAHYHHALIQPKVRAKIKEITISYLKRWKSLGVISALYSGEINDAGEDESVA